MQDNKPLNILITRPEPSGRQLADTLSTAGYNCYCQPLFEYQAKASRNEIKQTLAQISAQPWLIFVSVAAVEFAHQQLPISKWQADKIFAIGDATKKRLLALGVAQVIAPEKQISEGLLATPELNSVENQHIVIVRGDGGRELIATTLAERGAKVTYIESYQRQWLNLDQSYIQQWRNLKINCFIITSNALLETVVQLIKGDDNFWQNTCLWLVASERIADNAARLGLDNIVCSHGASDQAILSCLRNME